LSATNAKVRSQLLLTILIISIVAIPVGIKLAHTSRALGQLRARALRVADAVDLLPVAVEVLVAGAEFVREDGAGEAEEEEGGFVVHGCGLGLLGLVGLLVGVRNC
jgi:hypothetical protein